ncbi:50S ribosomal protein L23 [Candidatus Saccharibacteria bacterium]|nr:50S ribosomal protein L23 [Candidatus Saccharibacteria bacterium]
MSQFLITPRVTEKGYAQSQNGTYVFVVPDTLNKAQIASAVEQQYNVTVTTVNVVRQNGKAVRTHRGRGKFVKAVRSDMKKAYVRLKDGDSITVFEEAA